MATEDSPRAPKPYKISRFKISLNVLVQIVMLVLILGMLNYLSFNHYRRWDYSRTHRYALSEKTTRVLAGLKSPVKVIVFFSSAADIFADVQNLLKEYQYASKKIVVETVDTARNPSRANEVVSNYKIRDGENLVILDFNGRTKFIPATDMADFDTTMEMVHEAPTVKDFKGEQAITSGLLGITDEKPNRLYAVTGQGERDLGGEETDKIKKSMERENVKVQPVTLQDAVPQDAGMLFILGARYDFSEREIALLKDYWDKKGRLFVLLDPNAQTPRLNAFLAEQGIKVNDDRIMRIMRTDVPGVPGLMRDVTGTFTEGSPITKSLKGSTGYFLGGTQSLAFDIAKARADGIRLQMLVQASYGYWGEVDYRDISQTGNVPYFDPQRDHGQPLVVAASVEKGGLNDTRVQVASSRMIVVGNFDFVTNHSLSESNLDFTISALDWLLDREELIGIAPKVNKTLTMNLSDSQMSNLMMIVMVCIPGAAGLFGFALWWKRRH